MKPLNTEAEFKTELRRLAQKVKTVKTGLRDLLTLAVRVGEYVDRESPKGSHLNRWIIRLGLEKHSRLIKAAGSIHRRSHSASYRVESWKLRLLQIIDTVHHAKKPKRSNLSNNPAMQLIYHVNKLRGAAGKLREQMGDLPPEAQESLREQIQEAKKSLG